MFDRRVGENMRCPTCFKYLPDRCTCRKWKSVAEWPEGTTSDSYGRSRSEDTHDSKEQAQAVCNMLRYRGFGGDGKVFPLKTYVEAA